MRILNVSQNYFVAGGMDVAMFTLERVLTAHGHEVVPFAAADPRNRPTRYASFFPPAPPTEATGPGATLRTLYAPAARRSLARLLDAHPVDVVHLHSYFKRLTPAILPELRRRKLPIVQTLHEYRAVCPISTLFRDGAICTDCRGGRYREVLRHRCAGGSAARSAWNYAEMTLSDLLGHKRDIRRFIALSGHQRSLLERMGLDARRLVTIPHPVTLPIGPAPERRRGEVLFFGRLETAKGADLLVDLAAALPEARLVVAGDGSRRESLVRAAAERDLGNIAFLGMLAADALAAAIGRATCVVVPSLWPEAFGLTATEALAHATPVVAFATGGLLDTVRDGVDGVLVAPGDVGAMADAVRRLLADEPLARCMGEAGRRRMAEAFSDETFYRRTMAVYAEAMNEGARARADA